VSCQVVVETPKFNITSSEKCDVAIYCTLRNILDAIGKFTSTVWGGTVFALGVLLGLGMLKMCIEMSYCKYTDVDSLVLDIVAGKKRGDPKNAPKLNTEMKFALGSCFFVYLPLLPLLWAGVRIYRIWRLNRHIKRELTRQQRRSEWLTRKLYEIAGGPQQAMGF
jgi:hypothetical protein